jgi:hypothetical protein
MDEIKSIRRHLQTTLLAILAEGHFQLGIQARPLAISKLLLLEPSLL